MKWRTLSVFKPSWKIATASNLNALEALVNKIQEEGFVIEDINTTSLVVVYYKYNEDKAKDKELLLERQDEGRISQEVEDDYPAGFGPVDRDYGQQSF